MKAAAIVTILIFANAAAAEQAHPKWEYADLNWITSTEPTNGDEKYKSFVLIRLRVGQQSARAIKGDKDSREAIAQAEKEFISNAKKNLGLKCEHASSPLDILNALGTEGWEVIWVDTDGRPGPGQLSRLRTRYLLKRPARG